MLRQYTAPLTEFSLGAQNELAMLKLPFEITLRFKIFADKGTPLDFDYAEDILDIQKPSTVWKAGDPVSRSQQHRSVQYDAMWYELEWSLQD